MKELGVVWVSALIMPVALFGFLRPVLAHSAASTRDGVYTVEQAQQGKAIYQKECTSCHQDSLQGKEKNSPLIGDVFLNKWAGQTMSDLFMKTNTSMPATSPGSLTPDETVRVIAYILQMNKFPAGKSELLADPQALDAIQIDKP